MHKAEYSSDAPRLSELPKPRDLVTSASTVWLDLRRAHVGLRPSHFRSRLPRQGLIPAPESIQQILVQLLQIQERVVGPRRRADERAQG